MRRSGRRDAVQICALALALCAPSLGADDATERDFFEAKVRPALIEHCYPCHSTKSAKAKGWLRLYDRDATRAGMMSRRQWKAALATPG